MNACMSCASESHYCRSVQKHLFCPPCYKKLENMHNTRKAKQIEDRVKRIAYAVEETIIQGLLDQWEESVEESNG